MRFWRRLALAFVFLWFLLGGLAHFFFTEAEMRIVPAYVPWPRAAVLVSGAFELLGAAGLLWRVSRRAAGWGLFLLTLAVTPANITMLQDAQSYDVPPALLVARLPFQLVLLWLIWWSTAAYRRRGHRSGGF
ncbi:hypothetical protein GN316_11755 [Xylophilus sp. Kf1]|nr:hypothetical protein [Xylophilus sp. Kf1]